ncbi:hypothetical protein ACFE04_018045 [Oxalis oulophora]
MNWMNWNIIRRLGQGSFGLVSLIEDRDTNISFACKSCLYQNSESLKMEHELFNILAASRDDHIVGCLGEQVSFNNGNKFYHLMLEYAEKGTLADIIKEKGTLSENEVKSNTHQILQGLSCLHQNSIIHCDLKPENILVFSDNRLKIADLGLAWSAHHPKTQLHLKSTFRGTAQYMSPESIRDGKISTALDVWSVGCIVSEMLTGKAPWNYLFEEEQAVLFYKMIGEELVDGCRTPLVPLNLSEKGKDFLLKCFCRDPVRRWTVDMLLMHPFLSEDWQQQELHQHKLPLLHDLNFPPIEAENNQMMGHNCLLQDLNFPPPEFEDRTTKLTWLLDLNMPPPLC